MPRRKYTSEPEINLFWSNVAITADDNQCWLWMGKLSYNGYGSFYFSGKKEKIHRIAWMYPSYVIPERMCICHSCDVRHCCNPKHLFLGTHQDNSKDMVSKNRNVIISLAHENNPRAKLTESQVEQIRERYLRGNISCKTLAKGYGLNASSIWKIIKGINWK